MNERMDKPINLPVNKSKKVDFKRKKNNLTVNRVRFDIRENIREQSVPYQNLYVGSSLYGRPFKGPQKSDLETEWILNCNSVRLPITPPASPQPLDIVDIKKRKSFYSEEYLLSQAVNKLNLNSPALPSISEEETDSVNISIDDVSSNDSGIDLACFCNALSMKDCICTITSIADLD